MPSRLRARWDLIDRSGDWPTSRRAGRALAALVAFAWLTTHASTALAYGKQLPVNGATLQPTTLTLTWDYVPLATYRYCVSLTASCPSGGWISTGSTESATVSGLSAATTYYWQVVAYTTDPKNPTVPLDGGTWWSFTTLAPPRAFGKTSPANGATGVATTVTVRWEAAFRAENYEVCANTSPSCPVGGWLNVGNVTSDTQRGLDHGTTYYWQVRAVNAGGTTAADGGTWWSFTTVPFPPGSFTKLTPANGAAGQALSPTLTWSASARAVSFEYCVDTTNDGACGASWTSVGTSTSVALIGLDDVTTYYWQVRAVNDSGTTDADGGAWWTFTTLMLPPRAFGKTSPANGATGVPTTVTARWETSYRASSYEVCANTSPTCAAGGWVNVGNATSATQRDLAHGTTYYWQVRAVNTGGTTAADGGTWWRFTTQVAPPAPFGKKTPANGTVDLPATPTLTWWPSARAASYEYCADTTDDGVCGPGWTSAGAATSVGLIGLSDGTTYYWQVRAVNAAATTVADGGAWWRFSTEAEGGPRWTLTWAMTDARAHHTATLLPNGEVLVAGGRRGSAPLAGAELYDPETCAWTPTGALAAARWAHTATLLPNGQVLVAGGRFAIVGGISGVALASAELYDPATGIWTPTGSMATARYDHTATLLPDGKVLVAAGEDIAMGVATQTRLAEIYDPATRTWTPTGAMLLALAGRTATLLPNGHVLVSGGRDENFASPSAELYDPALGRWTVTGRMAEWRVGHTATLLPDGTVLAVGGYEPVSHTFWKSAERYDPATGMWTPTGSTSAPHDLHTATLMPDGQVLVVGGYYRLGYVDHALWAAERYDPAAGSWTQAASMRNGRYRHTATLLPSGHLLAAGGVGEAVDLRSSERYGGGPPAVTGVTPASGSVRGGTDITITGANFVSGSAVELGGAAATGVVVVNTTMIIAVAPPHAAGTVDVVVTPPGTGPSTLAGSFTYIGGGGATADLTGDLKSDIVWRHATNGEVWLWPMDGTARVSETYVRAVADTNWEIRGLGDQDGDGQADLLWRNRATGEIYLWPMIGATPQDEVYVGTVDPAYDIVGTGDFDGDGKSDILWRHMTLGDVWIWLMDGPTPLTQVYVDQVGPNYGIRGVGDLDADGKADIVWRHSTYGEVWVWLMNGTSRTSQTHVGTVSDVGYEIVGVADHTGDGKADILWHHATRGEVWIWPMNGTTILSQSYVDTVSDTGYQIVGSGDYNGDTKADILWHHATRGEVWVWLMDGVTKVSQTWVATVPEVGYQIVKVK